MSRYLRNRLQDRAKSLRPHCRFAPPVQISTIAPAIQRSWKGRRKDLDARACKLILGMTWTLLWFSLMPSCRSFSWIFSEGCEWTTRAGYAGYHSSGSENLPALEGHFWDTSWSTPCELACRTRSTVIRKASNLCRVARIELHRTAEHWRRHGCARGTERFFSHSLPETTSFVLIRRLLIIYDNIGHYVDSVTIMISFKMSCLKGNLIAKKNQKILLWTDRFEKRGLEGRLIEALY